MTPFQREPWYRESATTQEERLIRRFQDGDAEALQELLIQLERRQRGRQEAEELGKRLMQITRGLYFPEAEKLLDSVHESPSAQAVAEAGDLVSLRQEFKHNIRRLTDESFSNIRPTVEEVMRGWRDLLHTYKQLYHSIFGVYPR